MSFVNRTFLTRVFGLLGARVIGAIVVLSSAPILTRIYEPEEIGGWVIWFSFSLMLASLSSLGYAQSIVLPRRHRDGAMLLMLSLTACLVIGIAGGGIFWLLPVAWLQAAGIADVWYWGAGLAVMVPLIGFTECFGSWCVRRELFTGFAVAQGVIAAAIPVAQIAGNYVMERADLALIVGSILGQGVGILGLVVYIFFKPERPNWGGQGVLKRLRVVAVRQRAYPLFILPYNLIGTLRERFVFILLGSLSVAAAGLYGLAARIVNVPNNLLASSLKPVFYQILATRELGQLESEVKSLLVAVARLIVPVWVLLVVFAEPLFALVFGEKWRDAGLYAAALSFAAIPQLLGNWLDRIFYVTGNQKLVFRMEGVFSTLTVVMVSIAALLDVGPFAVVVTQTATLSAYFLIYLYKIFDVADFSFDAFFRVLRAVVLGGGIWFALIYGMKFMAGFGTALVVSAGLVLINTVLVIRAEYRSFTWRNLGGVREC